MNNYPYFRVIFGFLTIGTIVGTIIGSIIAPLWIAVLTLEFTDFFPMSALALIFGGFFAIIPALIVGIIIAYQKLYKNQKNIYKKLLLIGSFVSFSILFILVIIDSSEKINFAIIGSVSGAISSLITGCFVLPKSLNLENLNE